jgi:hypothetical protein
VQFPCHRMTYAMAFRDIFDWYLSRHLDNARARGASATRRHWYCSLTKKYALVVLSSFFSLHCGWHRSLPFSPSITACMLCMKSNGRNGLEEKRMRTRREVIWIFTGVLASHNRNILNSRLVCDCSSTSSSCSDHEHWTWQMHENVPPDVDYSQEICHAIYQMLERDVTC